MPEANPEGSEAASSAALSGGMPPDLLVRILINAEALDTIVVGGQALNLWGEHYFNRAADELRNHTPFQSKDIDFHGNAGAAAELARLLGGDLRIPSRDDMVTPNSAAVDVRLRGRDYTIDFLRSVAGLDITTMRERAQTLAVPLPSNTSEPRHTEVRLLHPIDVLLSRIAGVTVLRRDEPSALRQLAAAPIILREFIVELLEIGDTDSLAEAQNAARVFIDIGASPHNDSIMARHGIDILTHAAKLAEHPAWDPRFAEFQIRRACAAAMAKRDRRLAEASRRSSHHGR